MNTLSSLAGLNLVKGNNFAALLSHLKSLVDTYGGVMWPFQDTSGSTAIAYNAGLTLGRNIVINGTFSSWTADNPNGWTILEGGGANQITESSGACRIISDGGDAFARQTILDYNTTYQVSFDVTNVTSGSIKVGTVQVSDVQTYSTTGTKTFEFTTGSVSANDLVFQISRNTACDITIDNVVVQQKNIQASSNFLNVELLVDGNMEAADTSAWLATNATLSKQTTNPFEGTRVLRITRTGGGAIAYQNILVVGRKYKTTGYARGDGVNTPGLAGGASGFSGTSSTSWQPFEVEFTATGTSFALNSNGTVGNYVEFDNVSVIPLNPLNATISGATINQPTGTKLKSAYSFDGVNDFVNIYTPTLNNLFNPEAGTIILFAKVANAGVWSDGTEDRLITLAANGSTDYIVIRKFTTTNQISVAHMFGSVLEQAVSTDLAGTTNIFMVAWTWSKADDEAKLYLNGTQYDTTKTTLGTFAGNLDSTFCVIGSQNNGGALPWNGLITTPIILRAALTGPEILRTATKVGLA